MEKIKKAFGGFELNWKKLIIFSVIAGIYTGIMALLPIAENTSFEDISISYEWWVLFGIFIIMNSKSPIDSGLKCFVFFLISQPLVYLVQVPFFHDGWKLFGYYKPWFMLTLLTFPMGFIGNYIKKDKWWGLLILAPMLLLVSSHYSGFLNETITWFPHHLLSAIFCAVTVLIYPLVMFKDQKLKRIGIIIAASLIIFMTVIGITEKHDFYSTIILSSDESGEAYFDDTYAVSLSDSSYGKVYVSYDDNMACYTVNAEFKKPGSTELILTSPDGRETVYKLTIEKNTYEIVKSETRE